MPKFLVEVKHPADVKACTRVVHVFLTTGSHYLSQAEWGCKDGVHSAWMIVEADTKAEAMLVVPSAFRSETTITGLNRFSLDLIEKAMARHAQQSGAESPSGG